MAAMGFHPDETRLVFEEARRLGGEIEYGDDWDSARWGRSRVLSEVGLRMAQARMDKTQVLLDFIRAREWAMLISQKTWRDEALAEVLKKMAEAGAAGR
jgi:hypothetical protein